MHRHLHEAPRTDDLRLGDIVTLPDNRSFSVRMVAQLPENALGLRSLVALGDLEILLTPSRSGEVQMLLPAESLPPGASTAKRLCDGASTFWAPHLPAVGGAMGEVLFRLLLLRNVFAPLVVLDRSGDHVFFLRVGEVAGSNLRVTRMPLSALSSTPVARFAGVVDPVPATVLDPTKERPLPRPAHAPGKGRSESFVRGL
jgi:hypothetical protein